MIVGSVTADRDATINLDIADAGGQHVTVTAVIDTGFNGWLTLPGVVISALSIAPIGARRVTLADGNDVDMGLYAAKVAWDGLSVDVFALEAEGHPLVGMSLLYGYTLTVQVVDGGVVSISALP
jgi:clan AA aspartic protease